MSSSEAKQRETRVRVVTSLEHWGINIGDVKPEYFEGVQSPSEDLKFAIRLAGLEVQNVEFVAELDFKGRLFPTREIATVETTAAILVVPPSQAKIAAAFYPKKAVFCFENLGQVIRWLRESAPVRVPEYPPRNPTPLEVPSVLQEPYQRALAALQLGYSVVFKGPQGAGATMLARRLALGLGRLTYEESLELSKIVCTAGLLDNDLLVDRPFRAPHHTVSDQGIFGNGKRPGEVHLARYGVLFLDEAQEFRKSTLKALPLVAANLDTHLVFSWHPKLTKNPLFTPEFLKEIRAVEIELSC